MAVFHKIMNYSFHICYGREKLRTFYFNICKGKQFKISAHTTSEYGNCLVLINRKRVHYFQLPHTFVGHNTFCFIHSFSVLRQVKAKNLIAVCRCFFRKHPNTVIHF